LLHIAMLLALIYRLDNSNMDLNSNAVKWINNPKLKSCYDHLSEENNANNIKVQRILLDFSLENNLTEKKWNLISLNISNNVPRHLRNITINMVLVSSAELEDNLTLDHTLPILSEPELNRDGFNFENMQALQGWNNTNNISEVSTNSNNFSNLEDVRWQQYLNVDNLEASRKHCDSANCTENDITKSESFTAIASIFNEPSTSKDTSTLDISDIFPNPLDSITATDMPPSEKGISMRFDYSHLSLNTTGKEVIN